MIVLIIILIIIAAILSVLIYQQSGDAASLGPSIVGNQSLELFQQRKTRGLKKVIFWVTLALVIALLVLIIIIQATR